MAGLVEGDRGTHDMASGTPGLSVRSLSVSYGGALALRGVSIDVPLEGAVALLGPNGAGKTTLLRAISGVLAFHHGAPDEGTIHFDGEPLLGSSPHVVVRAGVSQVMEGRRIFPELTVAENLASGAHSRRDKAEIERSLAHVFELFPLLSDRYRQQAGHLSGGEQQMLAIARALMQRPRLLLLDEPSLGLAPQLVETIAETVTAIRRHRTAVLLVEQNAAMALSVTDHAYVLENGAIAKAGPSAQLMADPAIRELYMGVRGDGHRSYREYHERRLVEAARKAALDG